MGLGAATASAATFSIEGTRTLEWDGKRLTSNYLVKGSARAETKPWHPCEGREFPGAELRWGWVEGGDGVQIAWAELRDPSGTHPSIWCPRPPVFTEYASGDDVEYLSGDLGLAFGYDGTDCVRRPEAERIHTFPLRERSVITPASPGTAAVQEVTFSKRIREAAWPNWLAYSYSSYCLFENDGFEYPNPECARYFDSDLCATEYEKTREGIQSFQVEFVPTPTPHCQQARSARDRVRSRLRKDPAPKLRRFLLQTAQPRFLGECR